jgi:hypothetical protein
MMHGIVDMVCVIQILVQIACFSPEIFVESPPESSKSTILIETGLAAILR